MSVFAKKQEETEGGVKAVRKRVSDTPEGDSDGGAVA